MKDKSVLIFDSDDEIGKVCQLILEEYWVETLNNYENLLKEIERVKPDIILADVWLPNGPEETAVKTLYENDKSKDIPLILFSTFNDIEKMSERVKATAYIKKPFDINELRETVRRYIKQN